METCRPWTGRCPHCNTELFSMFRDITWICPTCERGSLFVKAIMDPKDWKCVEGSIEEPE